jgi:molybdate transport system substrate-binding protein
MTDGWIIYAAFGVLVCLLLWRVATQWRNAEAGNLRISLTILGIVALVMVVWQGARLLTNGATTAQDKTITMFAAASLTNALDDVDTDFTKQSGIKVVVRYGASSALAKQIEQGAQMDVFVSADLQWMDYCARKKATRVNLLGNKLVLIAAKDAKIDHVTIEPGFDLAKLAGDGRVATGDVRAVPVGLYAKAALERLGAWAAVEPKMVMAEDVRAALRMVARGQAPLGIVYETDAKIEPAVKVIGVFPDNADDPIIYPVALRANAKPDAARYFSFLGTQTAKSVFEKYGFKFLIKPTL